MSAVTRSLCDVKEILYEKKGEVTPEATESDDCGYSSVVV
jgi:hypothetical protein